MWTLAYLFVLFLVAACHVLLRGLDDKIRTRCFLRFFVLLGVCLFLLVCLQPPLYAVLLPVLAVCVSVLAGHLFVLTHGRGALMAFFAFLPFVGEAIAVALGFMRSNLTLTTLSMFAGKLARYVVMLWALTGVL